LRRRQGIVHPCDAGADSGSTDVILSTLGVTRRGRGPPLACAGGGPVSVSGFFEVDTEAVRSAGSGMLATGDALKGYADTHQMTGRDSHGQATLARSSRVFADRFSYLLRGLGDDAIDAGENLRATATSYEEADARGAGGLGGGGGGAW